MFRRYFFILIAIFVIGGFFSASSASSADRSADGFNIAFVQSTSSDIVINEIGAYESSGNEWIEIWNKGDSEIDIQDWKFWESDTSHKLSVSTTDSIMSANEYAVICQDENNFLSKYPDFSGSIFDSSWGSLKESGEEIGLKDNDGNFVEQFTYVTATDFSLERVNPFLADFTDENWVEHVEGNTVGVVNVSFSSSTAATSSTPVSTTSTAPTSTSTVTTTTSTPTTTPYSLLTTLATWSKIKINEIVSDPSSGNEWVELYNPTTSSLNLSSGVICDNTDQNCKPTTGTIWANDWLVIDLLSSRYLNNSGDSVILKNLESTEVDSVIYGGNLSAPDKGESLARKLDGVDTDNENDWAITTQITSGTTNIITAPQSKQTTGGNVSGGPAQEVQQQEEEEEDVNTSTNVVGDYCVDISTCVATGKIILNEIYPNPLGSDADEEFIEIKSLSSSTINLQDWKLSDLSRTSTLYGYIEPGQIVVWKRKITKIALNNTTKEQVALYDSNETLIDKVEYGKAYEEQSYSRDSNDQWQWTTIVTAGEENKIQISSSTQSSSQEDISIVWKINAPKLAEPGEMLIFDVEDSADPRGGSLDFVWDFGDGIKLTGGEVEHAYSVAGVYKITVSASSTASTTGETSFDVIVGEGMSVINSKIVISEIQSNPSGVDSREFIELFNSGSSTINLSGWSLRNKGKIFVVPPKTFIKPNNYLIFYKTITKFSLSNSGDKVGLFSPSDEVVDLIKFGKSEDGASYSLVDGGWKWVDEATPGRSSKFAVPTASEAPPRRGYGGISSKLNDDVAVKISTNNQNQSKSKIVIPMSLLQARESEKGDMIKVQGVVSVLPGIFGSQYFYISDNQAGIQVYHYKKDFPKLKIGDLVEVSGEISEPYGMKRLKTKDKNDIKILSIKNKVFVVSSTLDSLGEYSMGSLVKISGMITEIKSSYMYVDDGNDEIQVYFKKGANIDKKKFKEGENVVVFGVLEQARTSWQIWPRSQSDIKSLGDSEYLLKSNEQIITSASGKEEKDTAEKYLTATAGGVTTLILAFFARARGAFAWRGLRRAGMLAARIIRRG